MVEISAYYRKFWIPEAAEGLQLKIPLLNYAILNYPTPSHFGETDPQKLTIRFKDGDDEAIKLVKNLFVSEISSKEYLWKNTYKIKYILTVPKSQARKTNTSCERVAATLAKTLDWLNWVRGGLIRTKTVKKSTWRGRRPDYDDHLDSIKCRVSENYRVFGGNIMLLDDVFTLGATSNACSTVLRDRYPYADVYGLFLAKTMAKPKDFQNQNIKKMRLPW